MRAVCKHYAYSLSWNYLSRIYHSRHPPVQQLATLYNEESALKHCFERKSCRCAIHCTTILCRCVNLFYRNPKQQIPDIGMFLKSQIKLPTFQKHCVQVSVFGAPRMTYRLDAPIKIEPLRTSNKRPRPPTRRGQRRSSRLCPKMMQLEDCTVDQ